MRISKMSQLTGRLHTRDIDVTQEQLDARRSGMLIQNAIPHLTNVGREFIKSGITPEEWNHLVHGQKLKEDDS